MRKNIIIVILTISSLVSLTFAYIQKQRADMLEATALEQMKKRIIAEQAAEQANEERIMATEREQKMLEQLRVYAEALEQARRKK